jgi:hypothetical protein
MDGIPSPVLGREGEWLMDEAKRTYRDVKNDIKKAARGIDGTDTKDYVGNAGDEVGKDLGNLGDDIRRAGRQADGPGGEPDATPEPTM